MDIHTSQQEFAIWQPAWPTVESRSQSQYTLLTGADQDPLPGARGENIPFKLMTSLILGNRF
jgi:hypothetical protein